MAEIFFYAIVFYLLYRFIFSLLIPVYKTTQQVKQRFRDMNAQGGHQEYYRNPSPEPPETPPGKKEKPGEYIDFEEIK
jgi:hypothetical protein